MAAYTDFKVALAKEAGEFALEAAKKQASGGGFVGRPFSVRNPNPFYDPAVIHSTGPFRESLHLRQGLFGAAYGGNNAVVASVDSDSPVLMFLIGRVRPRSRMVRRPIDDATEDATQRFVDSDRPKALTLMNKTI